MGGFTVVRIEPQQGWWPQLALDSPAISLAMIVVVTHKVARIALVVPTHAHRDRGSGAQVLPPDVLAGTHNEQGVAVPQVVDRRGVSLATLASRVGEEQSGPAHEPVQRRTQQRIDEGVVQRLPRHPQPLARLKSTRRAAEDVPVGAVFRDAGDLGNAVLDLYRGGVPFWHLGFLNASMARAGSLEEGYVLIGAYPQERASWVESALKRVSESHGGRVVTHEEAYRIWERRFFPAEPVGSVPTPGRAFLQGARLPPTLVKLERKLVGVAIQGTVSRTCEVSLLAFDPAKGSAGIVDLSATTDIEFLQAGGHS